MTKTDNSTNREDVQAKIKTMTENLIAQVISESNRLIESGALPLGDPDCPVAYTLARVVMNVSLKNVADKSYSIMSDRPKEIAKNLENF